MGVPCPACGKVSQDSEFCDHCNADLAPPAGAAVPATCPLLGEGATLNAEQRSTLARAESSLTILGPLGYRRLHWLPQQDLDHWLPLLEERNRFALDVLPACQTVQGEGGLWLVVGTTGHHVEPWKDLPSEPILEELRRMLRHVEGIATALEELHEHDLVWLNFDPLELEQVPTDAETPCFRITNLDLELFPAGYLPERLKIKGAFTAPEISRGLADEIGPRTNVFQLALYCYYWLSRRLPAGLPGAGLDAFGFQMPSLRTFAPDLPPGLTAVIQKGLSQEPSQRHATPSAFASALADAVSRIEKRWQQRDPLTWEIGVDTRTGRAKTAISGVNEDSVLVKEYAEPRRALVAVADGITTCDVGSGALASSMTLDLLEQFFGNDAQGEMFGAHITMACDQAARNLLDWAIDQGNEADLRAGQDLMGTTLCVGWLQGYTLQIANIGDSRAYLIQHKTIEQLTVDGDLASGLLAAGSPPEQIRELGGLAKALRECVGGCHVSPRGDLQPLPECYPSLSRFPLMPGDTVILCTDGLVEEGAFLEPQQILNLVRHNQQLSALELARLLVSQADAMQRLPSASEPDGFGDNISCIVIRVS